MVEVSKGIPMETRITASSKWARLMERVCISGKTEKYMMANGAKV